MWPSCFALGPRAPMSTFIPHTGSVAILVSPSVISAVSWCIADELFLGGNAIVYWIWPLSRLSSRDGSSGRLYQVLGQGTPQGVRVAGMGFLPLVDPPLTAVDVARSLRRSLRKVPQG